MKNIKENAIGCGIAIGIIIVIVETFLFFNCSMEFISRIL